MMGQEQDYESAFNDASRDPAEAAAQDPVEEPTEEPTEEPAEEEPAEEPGEEPTEEPTEEPAEEPGEEPTEEPAEEEPAEEPGEGESPAPEGSKSGIDEEQLAAAYRRLAKEEQQNKQQQDQPTQQQQQDDAPNPREKTWKDYVSEDDQKVIDEYESEWSEVSRAEQVKRDAQLRHMQEVVYSDLKGALAPIVDEFQRLKVDAHFNAIRSKHSDFDDIREDVTGWVNEQPDFLRPAFEQVLKQGSAEQVNQLIDTYKQAKGKTGAAPEVPASSASKGGQKPARKAPSKAAKRAMAASPSPQRSNPPDSADSEDFGSAFDEAARGM